MHPADQRSLARSIRRLAIGVVRDTDARKTGRTANGFAEREEQFQIAISGTATDYPLWTPVTVNFDTAFTVATGRRDSMLQRPQLSTGFELTSVKRFNDLDAYEPVSAGVMFSAIVREWGFDQGSYTLNAATVLIGAVAPGDELLFSGFVHLTFQAFGVPRDDQPDEAG